MSSSHADNPPATRRIAMPPITDRRRLTFEAEVLSTARGGVCTLALDNGHRLTGFLSKKSRIEQKEVLPRRRIVVEISPFDLSHGQIIRLANQGRAAVATGSSRPLVVA